MNLINQSGWATKRDTGQDINQEHGYNFVSDIISQKKNLSIDTLGSSSRRAGPSFLYSFIPTLVTPIRSH